MQVTREQFDLAAEAVWSELQYQNKLPIRTDDDEAKDVPGFFTLLRVYSREGEETWARNAGAEKSLHFLRKCAAIMVRGMIYCGVRVRHIAV